MSKRYIELGSAPANEDCVQVGSEDYAERAAKECREYIGLIRRFCGVEPDGAVLKIKAFPHDFGAYYEVVCWYDEDNEEAGNYAWRVEKEAPTTWDADGNED